MSDETGNRVLDHALLEDMKRYLERSERFDRVEAHPAAFPDQLTCYFDGAYYPSSLDTVTLNIRWWENGDFEIHYREEYSDETAWDCRWDRHPNDHNTRDHYHPGPDADRASASDESFPDDWRDVLERVLTATDDRRDAFWQ